MELLQDLEVGQRSLPNYGAGELDSNNSIELEVGLGLDELSQSCLGITTVKANIREQHYYFEVELEPHFNSDQPPEEVPIKNATG